jgi:hypothetical protein
VTIEHLEDRGQDAKFFILTPQLVWALSDDPYDFTLWSVIKMVAGEEGECYLNTRQLAAMAMMSVGKVTTSRKRLIDAGLLEGEIRQDPGYRQPVWHMRIPDLWRRNLEWRETHHDLGDRLRFKEERKSVHQVNTCEKRSPGELERSPGETKNIQEEQPPDDGGGDSFCEPCFELLTQTGYDEPTARELARTAHNGSWGEDACRLLVWWEKDGREAESKGRCKNRLGLLRSKITAGAIPPKRKNAGSDGDEQDRRRYITGAFADIIEH